MADRVLAARQGRRPDRLRLGVIRTGGFWEQEQGGAAGEFGAAVDAEVFVDSLIGPVYYRLLMKAAPLSEGYVDELIAQLVRGTRG